MEPTKMGKKGDLEKARANPLEGGREKSQRIPLNPESKKRLKGAI